MVCKLKERDAIYVATKVQEPLQVLPSKSSIQSSGLNKYTTSPVTHIRQDNAGLDHNLFSQATVHTPGHIGIAIAGNKVYAHLQMQIEVLCKSFILCLD